jgi:hypothetical protein
MKATFHLNFAPKGAKGSRTLNLSIPEARQFLKKLDAFDDDCSKACKALRAELRLLLATVKKARAS